MPESLCRPFVDGWRSIDDRDSALALVDGLEAWFEATGRLNGPLKDYLRRLRVTMMEWSLPADRAIGLERQSREALVSNAPFERFEDDLLMEGGDSEALRAQWGWGWFMEQLVWLMAEGLGNDVCAGLRAVLVAGQPAE